MFFKKRICEDCGTIGSGKTKVSGSAWVEWLLWIVGFLMVAVTFGLSLIVPLIYSLSRATNTTKVCKKCNGKMIDIDTPRAKKLIKDLEIEQ